MKTTLTVTSAQRIAHNSTLITLSSDEVDITLNIKDGSEPFMKVGDKATLSKSFLKKVNDESDDQSSDDQRDDN